MLPLRRSFVLPRFKIIPTDQSFSSAEIVALDAAAVLNIVGQLDCGAADVLQDGKYTFSVRLSRNGLWTIFRYDDAERPCDIQSFG
jgi:hypothetical protein